MTENFEDENNDEKSFAALLEDYSPGKDAVISVGNKIRGKLFQSVKTAFLWIPARKSTESWKKRNYAMTISRWRLKKVTL